MRTAAQKTSEGEKGRGASARFGVKCLMAVQHNQTPHRVAHELGRHVSSPQGEASSQAGGTTRPTCWFWFHMGDHSRLSSSTALDGTWKSSSSTYPVLLRWVAESSMGPADQMTPRLLRPFLTGRSKWDRRGRELFSQNITDDTTLRDPYWKGIAITTLAIRNCLL